MSPGLKNIPTQHIDFYFCGVYTEDMIKKLLLFTKRGEPTKVLSVEPAWQINGIVKLFIILSMIISVTATTCYSQSITTTKTNLLQKGMQAR